MSLIIKEHLESWYSFYDKDTIAKLDVLCQRLILSRQVKRVYPSNINMLRLFRWLPVEKISCIVLAAEPHHDDNGNGFAFGCKHNIHPITAKVIESMREYIPEPTVSPIFRTADLTYLVQQGVFLMNMSFTSEQGIPNAHKEHWEFFTKATIEIINNNTDSVVWCLWGTQAKKYKKLIDNPSHYILEAKSPNDAVYQNYDWDCDNFLTVNEFLKQVNKREIQWR